MSQRLTDLRKKLRDPFASRVLTLGDLGELAPQPIARRTLIRLADTLADAGDVYRVRRGLFLNRLAPSPPDLDEAAQHVRTGAVVSLQRVLGQNGVLNNPSRIVTCVVPLDAHSKGHARDVDLPGGAFRFTGVSRSILESGDEDDRLEWTPYPRATSEAALLHWIYLGQNNRSPMTGPPAQDIDGSELDLTRFHRLATAMGIAGPAAEFAETMHYSDDADDRYDLRF